MELTGKTVLVVGAGKSGIAAAGLLHSRNIDAILYDSNETLTEDAVREKLPEGVSPRIVLGELTEEVLEAADLAVLSPGVPTDAPFVEAMRRAGLPIWGEIELAWQFEKGRVIAITGTNGKTTTTALVGHIMEKAFQDVFVVGNIGVPYTSMVTKSTPDSVSVLEVSSFQLETIHGFHPVVSAVLNVTPDHLNRHYTMENYANAKFAVTKNQTGEEVCVLNYDNDITRRFGEGLTNCRPLFFSHETMLPEGICAGEDMDAVLYCHDGQQEEICRMSRSNLLGVHNLENVMAAVGMALAMGVTPGQIAQALREFQAVEHRIEYVTEKKGVVYYNDSKGTNTDAAIKGIQAMVRPTVLIGGGYDKKTTFDDWMEACKGKVTAFVLLGQTAAQIGETAEKHGFTDITYADSLEEAVKICAEKARPGDAVLLSPACASWGMFDNYEQRGRMFKDFVRSLPD